MRVVLMSIFDRVGGGCIAGYRQHEALRRHGVDSRLWVRHKVTADEAVTSYEPSLLTVPRVRRVWRRWFLSAQRKRCGVHAEFFDDRSQYGSAALDGMPAADVLNVQFSQDFLDHPAFYRRAAAAVPIVVSMHEMSPFTGGCPYAGTCAGFRNVCGHCPLLGRRGPGDLSARAWRRKRTAYARRPAGLLHFVANSQWLADQARQSSLLAGYPVSVIHLGLDLEVFRPLDRRVARDVLRIPPDCRVVCFAAAAVADERKGMRYLVAALAAMQPQPFLLTWGQGYPPELAALPHLHLGSVSSEHLLALAYSAGDLFAMPSLEEAFGLTALEAIACGTPVVAFAAGGIPDTVRHERTGLLVPVGDGAAFRETLSRLLADAGLRAELGRGGRALAEEEFSYARNATRYQELYAELLERSGRSVTRNSFRASSVTRNLFRLPERDKGTE